jgi:hypothetical protein
MPDGTRGKKSGVLLLLAEDSLQKTVLHRLGAAGADLRQIPLGWLVDNSACPIFVLTSSLSTW